MSDKSLKVTDKRMFTAEGELREEFRRLEQESAPGANEELQAPAPLPEPPAAPPLAAAPLADAATARADGAGFFDLVGLLAEPASVYLQEARAAGPAAGAQSLELARLHVDLLMILQDKTRGNLSFEEEAALEDVVHRLRAAYVGFGG